MHRFVSYLPVLGLFVFASFSSSSNFQLKSYGINSGGTNNSQSTTYSLQGATGETVNGTTSSTNFTAKNGSVQTYQLNQIPAPTIGNGSNTYYNQLSCIINTVTNPTDTVYAVGVSTDSFVSNQNYVQATNTLGGSPVFQSYASWGSGSGFIISGLSPSTTYYVRVYAKEGQFTGVTSAIAPVATVSPTITFSVSPNSSNIGTFLPNTIQTSSNLSFTYATNANSGGNIYVNGTNNGFKSTIKSYTIPAFTGDLSSASQGFGIQATNPSQTTGGPLTKVSPFDGTGNVVGAESTTFAAIFSSVNPLTGGAANANVQVRSLVTAPAANDYNEVFTFIAAANF